MKQILIVSLTLVYAVSHATLVEASLPDVYTNENIFTATHEMPADFVQHADGGFSGSTTSGRQFTQQPLVADMHIRLHRFSLDEAVFYVSSFGIITADSDAEALSIYLSMAGWDTSVQEVG